MQEITNAFDLFCGLTAQDIERLLDCSLFSPVMYLIVVVVLVVYFLKKPKRD